MYIICQTARAYICLLSFMFVCTTQYILIMYERGQHNGHMYAQL